MPEDGAGQKMYNAFGLMCAGILFFPVALYILGSNEKNYMCTHKNIIFADERAKAVECDQQMVPDGIGYMACPIKQESFLEFTGTSFGSSGIGPAIHFKSAVGAQKAEMFQCVESVKTERHGNNTVKVYSYQMTWSSSAVRSASFAQTPQAIQAREYGCPGATNGNPSWPANLAQGVQTQYAREMVAGPLTIDADLIHGGASSGLHANMANPVPLNQFKSAFAALQHLPYPNIVTPQAPPMQTHGSGWYTQTVHQQNHHARRLFFSWNQMQKMNPFSQLNTLDLSSISTHNLAVDASGTFLVTCQQARLGCIRIQYFKNWDTMVTLISAVQGGRTLPIDVPASWGCPSSKYNVLVGGLMSKMDLTQMLESANTTGTWTMRVIGLLFAWWAVYCCFQPISSAIDVVGDCVRAIPCLGPILEDLLEGMMTCLLCVVSCGCGCSCGLFVIGVVWLYMRPLIGGGLLAICAALAVGAYALGYTTKGAKGSRSLVSEMQQLTGESNEAA
ncbi:unnamed protein product [Durusdinium trenchii]|uniref:Transmembrane protein n=2 Tax=Durusdinium trenchii TaxID=1381693 RepID=A0ABP0J579_9DINO